jgi:hypothetical protein
MNDQNVRIVYRRRKLHKTIDTLGLDFVIYFCQLLLSSAFGICFWASAPKGANPSYLITYGCSFCKSVCTYICTYILMYIPTTFPPMLPYTEMGYRESVITIVLATVVICCRHLQSSSACVICFPRQAPSVLIGCQYVANSFATSIQSVSLSHEVA